jgi:hypothetical protein
MTRSIRTPKNTQDRTLTAQLGEAQYHENKREHEQKAGNRNRTGSPRKSEARIE